MAGPGRRRSRLFARPALNGGEPLAPQLARHLRRMIVEGTIGPDARLPGQRTLASDWQVSRNTILAVLQQLESEGLVATRQRSGVFVARDAAGLARAPKPAATNAGPTALLPLDVGAPALEMFPMAVWRRLQAKRWRRMSAAALGDGPPGGLLELRAVIAQRLAALRGLRCRPEQVFITPNVQVAVGLSARAVASAGEAAWVEDPGYGPSREALAMAGLRIVLQPVGPEGFDAGAARAAGEARLALVTPARQFPTGATMSAAHRKVLIEWAAQSDGWIIEDDFESDFWFETPPPPSLAAEPGGAARVIHVSTFSTTLFPGLRIAFLVAPEGLVDRLTTAGDRQIGIPNQLVLLDFIEQGHLAAHIRSCREVYGARRGALAESLRARFGQEAVAAPSVGLHLVLQLPAEQDDRRLRALAASQGLTVSAFGDHAVLPTRPGLFLGFAPYTPAQITAAVDHLAHIAGELAP